MGYTTCTLTDLDSVVHSTEVYNLSMVKICIDVAKRTSFVYLVSVGLLDTEAFIKELSEHIGGDWKALARELGLSKTDVDAIKYDNRLSMKDQIFEFFYKWKQREGKDVSVQKLIDGLKAAKLEEQLKKMHEAGLTPG